MRAARKSLLVAAAALAVAGGLLSNGKTPMSPSGFVSGAEARIGRPLTPMSYAGVARRTTRRAVAVGAAGAAAAGAYYYTQPGGPGCVQVVNAYGQLQWQCP
jgi:hypothetical protein